MKDFCFCTLALGEKYDALAKQLAYDLAEFAPGAPLVILTNSPDYFKKVKNVLAFLHKKRSAIGYNDKLCVINKALQLYRTCIFLDADGRIFDNVVLENEIFEPGLRAYRVRSWTYNRNEALDNIQHSWARGGLRIMRLLRQKFALEESDEEIPFVVEFLFSITKDDNVAEFLRKWEQLAIFCESKGFYIHEGYSIGLAALMTGFPVTQHSFKGLNFFESLIPLTEHVAQGRVLSENEYNNMKASVQRLKTELPRDLLSRILRRAKRELLLSVRYAKIKTLGLKLLS